MILLRLLAAVGILTSTAAAVAQNLTLADVPTCALQCVAQSVAKSPCSLSDTQCLCTNHALEKSTSDCVLHQCSIVDGYKLQIYQAQICNKGDDSAQFKVRAWLVCQLAAVGITSLLRLFSCWRVKGAFYPEDYLIIVSCAVCGFMSSNVFIMLDNGFGQHVWQVQTEANISKIYFYYWITEIAYAIQVNLIKVSLLCLFHRIFPNKKFRVMCILMICFLVGIAIMWTMLLTFQCHPVDSSYNIYVEGAKCKNVQLYAFVGAGSSMVEDITIILMPIPLLLKLQVDTRKKVGVLVLFSLGIFVVITSGIRIRSIYLFNDSADPTWDNVELAIWTAFEIAVAVVCCNLPSIAGLFAYYKRIYFPARPSGPEARHLKWTNTDTTGGMMSPRLPPSGPASPRFPPKSPGFPPHSPRLPSRLSESTMVFQAEEVKEPQPRIKSGVPAQPTQSLHIGPGALHPNIDLESGRRCRSLTNESTEEAWPLPAESTWPLQPLQPASFHKKPKKVPPPIQLIEHDGSSFEMVPSPGSTHKFPPRGTSLQKGLTQHTGFFVTKEAEVDHQVATRGFEVTRPRNSSRVPPIRGDGEARMFTHRTIDSEVSSISSRSVRSQLGANQQTNWSAI